MNALLLPGISATDLESLKQSGNFFGGIVGATIASFLLTVVHTITQRRGQKKIEASFTHIEAEVSGPDDHGLYPQQSQSLKSTVLEQGRKLSGQGHQLDALQRDLRGLAKEVRERHEENRQDISEIREVQRDQREDIREIRKTTELISTKLIERIDWTK